MSFKRSVLANELLLLGVDNDVVSGMAITAVSAVSIEWVEQPLLNLTEAKSETFHM